MSTVSTVYSAVLPPSLMVFHDILFQGFDIWKEKFYIMFKPATATLNKRNEIYASCRHRTSKLLAKS